MITVKHFVTFTIITFIAFTITVLTIAAKDYFAEAHFKPLMAAVKITIAIIDAIMLRFISTIVRLLHYYSIDFH